jgi:beta-glucanase (GH16 family)
MGPGVADDGALQYPVGTHTIGPAAPPTPGPTPPGPTPTPPGPTPSTPSSAGPAGQNPSDYTMTFDEEFNGALDTNVWNDHIWYESPNPTQNFAVENGVLEIWPQRDANGNFFNRTLDTDGHYTQTYGYFEMEAKLPKGVGTWPAFWLFNHIGDRRPEIDVREAYPGGDGWGLDGPNGLRLPVAYGATIWLDANVRGGFDMIDTPDLSAAPHKYGVRWEPNKQTFYFDGGEVYSANVSMSDPMYILLDLWFGSASGQPGSGTPTGKGNAYEVNYVRAWQHR